jgi:hypothetical protein
MRNLGAQKAAGLEWILDTQRAGDDAFVLLNDTIYCDDPAVVEFTMKPSRRRSLFAHRRVEVSVAVIHWKLFSRVNCRAVLGAVCPFVVNRATDV